MSAVAVYGAGNALVDKEFEVGDDFLVTHGIARGRMTLVGREHQDRLLAELAGRHPLKAQAGGGSAANTLYAVSQFGGTAFLSCKVAADEDGAYYMRELGNHNIRTNPGSADGAGVTGRCLVMVGADAERTMLTHLGISAELSEGDLDFEAARRAQYVYLEGYLVASPTALDALARLKAFAAANGVKTSLTLSDPSMAEHFRPQLDEVMGLGVDLLFCNEQEALVFTDTQSLDEACAALRPRARQFAITRGSRGALVFDGQGYHELPGEAVTAVDSNGAGDMFAGAFLYALTAGMTLPAAGRLANRAAAAVVQGYGSRLPPPRHAELLRDAPG